MAITANAISKAISEVKKKSKKRNFVQSVDLAVNLKDIDMNKPENRLNEELILPHGRGKPVKICVIGEQEIALQAKKIADRIISKKELEALAEDRKAARKLANEMDFFVSPTELMPLVGKSLGPILGPRGKMPKPLPPGAPLEPIVERLKKTVRIRTKDNPVIHIPIGTENMDDQKLVENAEAALKFIERKLEKGLNNIKSVYLSTTMGPSIKVEG
jgi:large subunit ribosomal protein L1